MSATAYQQGVLPFDERERLSRQWLGKDVIYGRVVARIIGFQWWNDHIGRALKQPDILHVALLPLRWDILESIIERPWRRDERTGVAGPIKGPWRIREIRPEPHVFTVHAGTLRRLKLVRQK